MLLMRPLHVVQSVLVAAWCVERERKSFFCGFTQAVYIFGINPWGMRASPSAWLNILNWPSAPQGGELHVRNASKTPAAPPPAAPQRTDIMT